MRSSVVPPVPRLRRSHRARRPHRCRLGHRARPRRRPAEPTADESAAAEHPRHLARPLRDLRRPHRRAAAQSGRPARRVPEGAEPRPRHDRLLRLHAVRAAHRGRVQRPHALPSRPPCALDARRRRGGRRVPARTRLAHLARVDHRVLGDHPGGAQRPAGPALRHHARPLPPQPPRHGERNGRHRGPDRIHARRDGGRRARGELRRRLRRVRHRRDRGGGRSSSS